MQSAGLGPETLGGFPPAFPPAGNNQAGDGSGAQFPPALFGLLNQQGTPGANPSIEQTGNNSQSPFGMVDPNLLQQLMGGFGGTPTALGGAGNPPSSTRPPEERFEEQLQQLRDMGFVNANQNVRALLATGGNVHAAIEYILGGGGL